VNCTSSWGTWSTCTAPCGGGTCTQSMVCTTTVAQSGTGTVCPANCSNTVGTNTITQTYTNTTVCCNTSATVQASGDNVTNYASTNSAFSPAPVDPGLTDVNTVATATCTAGYYVRTWPCSFKLTLCTTNNQRVSNTRDRMCVAAWPNHKRPDCDAHDVHAQVPVDRRVDGVGNVHPRFGLFLLDAYAPTFSVHWFADTACEYKQCFN